MPRTNLIASFFAAAILMAMIIPSFAVATENHEDIFLYDKKADVDAMMGPNTKRGSLVYVLSKEIQVDAGLGFDQIQKRTVYVSPGHRFTEKMGFCYVTQVRGRMDGMGQVVNTSLDTHGWTMLVKGSPVQALFRCVTLRKP